MWVFGRCRFLYLRLCHLSHCPVIKIASLDAFIVTIGSFSMTMGLLMVFGRFYIICEGFCSTSTSNCGLVCFSGAFALIVLQFLESFMSIGAEKVSGLKFGQFSISFFVLAFS